MTRYLLDINLLIALAWPQHIHHGHAHAWFATTGRKGWATCPVTQLGFVRISSNPKIIPEAVGPRDAAAMLVGILAVPGHQFWAADLAPATAVTFASLALVGHRQVTDGYLVALAQRHAGKLATFDRGIADLLAKPIDASRAIELVNLQ